MTTPQRTASIDPTWTFEQMIAEVNHQYPPGGMRSGIARNAVVEAWAAAVGGTCASIAIEEYIHKAGSKTAAAKLLQMSAKTLSDFRDLFRTLPDPPEVIREGLLLLFSEPLASIDRWLVDAIILTVLGEETECRLVEIVDQDDIYMLRFAYASADERRMIGDALWHKIWRDSPKYLPVEEVVAGVTHNAAAINRLDAIRDVLGYMELRSSSDSARILGSNENLPMRQDQLKIQSWGETMKTLK